MPEVQLTLNDALQMALQQHQAGNLAAAEHICRRILAIEPGQPDALRLLGVLLGAAGGTPGDEGIAALIDQGRLDEAEAALLRAIELDPNNPHLQLRLGDLLWLKGQPAAAISVYSETINRSPDSARAYTARGVVFGELKLLDEAMADHRRALELAPRDANAHLEMAKALSYRGDVVAAEALCRQALEIDPESASAWECLGRVLQNNGRFDDAAQAFGRSLEIRPSAAVTMQLGTMEQQTDRRQVNRLAARLIDPQVSAEDRVLTGFALGKMLDEADRFDEAFAAYARANALFKEVSERRGCRFDIDRLQAEVAATIGSFTSGFFQERSSWGDASEMPVFIVGMPRSGTSLVEQIAASHSQVFGAGERSDIGIIRSRLAAGEQGDSPAHWDQQAIFSEARAQLERLTAIGGGAQRVIDKMPSNLLQCGLIAMLFPRARIIFCQRDARDTCLSCFFQLFTKNSLMFSYDLTDCGRTHRQYDYLTAHWRQVLPLRHLVVQYEELVADLQGQSRRLIEFLGLSWEEQCLEFHKKQRPVLTRSFWQVRQPIYSRSVGRWKHYEKHLAPLLEGLAGEIRRTKFE